jgi:chromosome segregation ATPase
VLPLNIPSTFPSELSKNLSKLTADYKKENDSLNAYIKTKVHAPSDLKAAAYYTTSKKFEGDIGDLLEQALILRNSQTQLKERLRSLAYQYEQGNASLVRHLTQELQGRNLSWSTRAEEYTLALRTSPKSISNFRAELEDDLAGLQRVQALLAAMTAENEAFDARYEAVMDYLNGLLDEIDQMEASLMNMWFELELLEVAESEIMGFLNKVVTEVQAGRISVGCGQNAIANVVESAV